VKTLLPHHLAALAARWITPELAHAAGLYSVDSHDGVALVGRNGRGDYSGIAIPYKRRDGSIREYRLRRDNPDLETGADGKLHPKAKYLSPPGAPVLTYDPPDVAKCKPDTPLILVEGQSKAPSPWRLAIHETDTRR